jgi:tetratricopeptide (TPR) repeat protein
MAWTITNRLEEPALRLAASMQNFWGLRDYWVEGRKWLENSLYLGGSNSAFPHLRAKALCELGFLAVWMWDFEAATNYSQESLAIYESLGDVRGCAHARGNLWRVAYFQGDFNKALPLARENLAELQQVGDKWWSTAVFGMIGIIKQKMGAMEGVRECYEETLRLSNGSADKEFSNPQLTALYTQMLGSLALDNQDLERAARLFKESVKLDRELGSTLDLGIALGQLSVVEMFQGNYEHARVLNEESMFLFRKIGNKSDLIISLWRFGILMLLLENYNYAAKLFKECLVLSQEYISVPDKQADLATCLEGLAYLAWHNGKAEKAEQLIETAQTIRLRINLPLVPLERLMQDRFIKVLKERLESRRKLVRVSSGEEGPPLNLEQVIAQALHEDLTTEEK